jgi:3-hydroxymyristoyl/3-hydroxydecanoyl-(acyl carrier protein) dehydratase
MPDSSRTLCVNNTHPALPGHFPGAPVVPGVVLLSEILADLQRQLPQVQVAGIKKLKFLRMLFPEQRFTVEFAEPLQHNLRFKCWQDGALLAEGNLALQLPEAGMTCSRDAGQPV